MGRSTGFALLKALGERGYVTKQGDGCYRLGETVRNMAFSSTEAAPQQVSFGLGSKQAGQALADMELSAELFELADPTPARSLGPWRLGFANASSSNPWRKALLNSAEHAVRVLDRQICGFQSRDAGDDPLTQASQIDAFVQENVDAILLSATPDPDNVLAGSLMRCQEQGIPVIAVDRRPNDRSGYAVFVTASDELIGKFSAIWLAETLQGQGRVWLQPGLDQASPARRRLTAAKMVFARFPGLNIEGERFSGWTEDGGFQATQDLMLQHGQAPDGVWCDSGLQGVGSIRAFQALSERIPPHTGGDINGMFRTALKLKVPFCAFDYPAAMGARAVEVAVEVLKGATLPRRVEVPVPAILPRGTETRSIKADILAEHYVRWDLPDDTVLSQGLSLRGRPAR